MLSIYNVVYMKYSDFTILIYNNTLLYEMALQMLYSITPVIVIWNENGNVSWNITWHIMKIKKYNKNTVAIWINITIAIRNYIPIVIIVILNTILIIIWNNIPIFL